MVRPELRLRGRSASEEDQESLCDSLMLYPPLDEVCACVWFFVFLLDLGSQALVYACVSLVFLLTGESSQNVSCVIN